MRKALTHENNDSNIEQYNRIRKGEIWATPTPGYHDAKAPDHNTYCRNTPHNPDSVSGAVKVHFPSYTPQSTRIIHILGAFANF